MDLHAVNRGVDPSAVQLARDHEARRADVGSTIAAVPVGNRKRIEIDVLARRGESKTVVVDPDATYFGTPLGTNSLVVPA